MQFGRSSPCITTTTTTVVLLTMPEAPPELSLKNSVAEKCHDERQREALDFIEKMTNLTDEVQKRVLFEILERNGDTEYLRKCGLNGRTDMDAFKKLVPVVSYEDIQPFIKRIADGDKSPILSAHPVTEFLTSSGTSAGERKLMPTIEEEFERKSLLYSLLMPVMNQNVSGLDKGKGMYFLFVKAEAKTAGGLPARPVLTSYYKSRWFDRSNSGYTSPAESILCLDSFQSMYCQMLCGLLQRSQVVRVGAVFASGFLRAIAFLEEHWAHLCQDICSGKLSSCIQDESLRDAVCTNFLRHHARPELAAAIEYECRTESWKGIISRLWPYAKYVDVIVTGTMAQYIPTLDFYSDGLPLVSTMYASSECYFGLNLNPLCSPSQVRYTIMPNMGYFEFLPYHRTNSSLEDEEHSTEAERLIKLADLKVGQEYELVVTTYAGLYRYKVGDILRVSGYYNRAPQLEFVCRKNVVLSIDSDKTDEETLHKAITVASIKHLEVQKARLIEYTSYAQCSTLPGHYVLYWELRWDDVAQANALSSSQIFEACCLSVEESLDSVYKQNRVGGLIGALEIRVVKHGTFDQLMDYCLNRGASINQYKTPRCVSGHGFLQLLDSRVTETYFSPKCPISPHCSSL